MKAQFIEKNSEPEWAVVPYAEYLRLIEAKEMLEDIVAFDAAIGATDEEIIPHTVVRRLVEGENPVRVWREHRGQTQQQLANQAGIRTAYLSQIEGGKRTGSARVLASLAKALRIGIEDLLDNEEQVPSPLGEEGRGEGATD
jgi:DNA-binding XRE family transcriptional regulator